MKHDNEFKKRVLDLYQERASAIYVATELCIGTSTVYRILDDAGVPRAHGRKGKGSRLFDDATIELLKADYADGQSTAALADKYGGTRLGIAALLKRQGVVLRPRGAPPEEVTSEEAEEIVQAYQAGEKIRSIQARLGKGAVVRRVLQDHGLTRRPYGGRELPLPAYKPPKLRKVLLQVEGHEERRDIEKVWNEDHTKVIALRPVKGSHKAFVLLKTSTGREVKAQLSLDDFDYVMSLWVPDWEYGTMKDAEDVTYPADEQDQE